MTLYCSVTPIGPERSHAKIRLGEQCYDRRKAVIRALSIGNLDAIVAVNAVVAKGTQIGVAEAMVPISARRIRGQMPEPPEVKLGSILWTPHETSIGLPQVSLWVVRAFSGESYEQGCPPIASPSTDLGALCHHCVDRHDCVAFTYGHAGHDCLRPDRNIVPQANFGMGQFLALYRVTEQYSVMPDKAVVAYCRKRRVQQRPAAVAVEAHARAQRDVNQAH